MRFNVDLFYLGLDGMVSYKCKKSLSKRSYILTLNKKNTSPEYHWHWHRIIGFIMFLVVLIVSIILGFSYQANAGDKTDEMDNQIIEQRIDLEAGALPLKKPVDVKNIQAKVLVTESEKQPLNKQKIDTKTHDNLNTEQLFKQAERLSKVSASVSIDTQYVTRALLTSQVLNREPVDLLNESIFATGAERKIYFFTELKNMKLKKVQHIWYFEGQKLAQVSLDITHNRHRTYSSKRIMPNQVGNWRVELIDKQYNVLASKSFRIVEKNRILDKGNL